jgi:hypothetical protein
VTNLNLNWVGSDFKIEFDISRSGLIQELQLVFQFN